MVVGLAFVAVVVSTLFAQAMLVRFTAAHQPQHRAWAIALAMFALASVALATGVSTGWDNGTFRVFYLLGAVLNVPWLAMGTLYLFVAAVTARRALWGLAVFSGFAAGVACCFSRFLMLMLYCLINSRNSAGKAISAFCWTLSRSFFCRLMNVPSPVPACPLEAEFLSLPGSWRSPLAWF